MKLITTIFLINDFLILNFALIESKFWAIFFGQSFTFEYFLGWSVEQSNINKLEPLGTSFNNETIAVLTGDTFADIILRFCLGVGVFIVVKLLLGMILHKIGFQIANQSLSIDEK